MSDEEGMLVDPKYLADIDRMMRFLSSHASNIRGLSTLLPEPNNNGEPDLNIRGILLQDMQSGDSGIIAVLTRPVFNYITYRVDLFGLWDVSKLGFSISITIDDQVVIETPTFTNGAISAADLKAALITASQTTPYPLAQDNVIVSIGSPLLAPLVPNSRLDIGNYVEGDTVTECTPGVWLISLSSQSLLAVRDTVKIVANPATGGLINDSSLVRARVTKDVWCGQYVKVTDVLDVAYPNPLKRGSNITASWFNDVGYGIQNVNGKEFYIDQLVANP